MVISVVRETLFTFLACTFWAPLLHPAIPDLDRVIVHVATDALHLTGKIDDLLLDSGALLQRGLAPLVDELLWGQRYRHYWPFTRGRERSPL